MKLSQAIEEALTSGVYNQCNAFMCNVLVVAHGKEMEQQLQGHLGEIFQNEGKRPLINQLWCIEYKKPGFNEHEFWETNFERTQEWYVWFVFDLKRKGL
ncbi:MAG: hypothetical protein [Bacteriophage sp.]|nr:MAG: hypothetical protein [Bacteriophage sp.]